MKYPPQDAPTPDSAWDATLRQIAHVPPPEGLEERVHAAVLNMAPRRGRILAWPVSGQPQTLWAGRNWMRAAAAAAIVFAVAGGGWGVYRRVEHPAAKVVVMPAATATPSRGFSTAGAMRKPQTVKGPIVQLADSTIKPKRKKKAVRPAVAVPLAVPVASGQAAPAVSAPARGAR